MNKIEMRNDHEDGAHEVTVIVESRRLSSRQRWIWRNEQSIYLSVNCNCEEREREMIGAKTQRHCDSERGVWG